MAVTVVLEVEIDCDEVGARALSELWAGWILSSADVLSVTADAKVSRDEALPITAAYLKDGIPGQMDVHECIAEASRA